MKRIAILGSTGSIGTSTLEVARHLGPEKIQVTVLAAKGNVDLIEKQVLEFNPKLVCLYDQESAKTLKRRMPNVAVVTGMEGLKECAAHDDVSLVVSAMTGTMGLIPTMQALESGKDLALANKEALVSGGALIMEAAKKSGSTILPVDSEHMAIFQCLQGNKRAQVNRLILTASGGPFRNHNKQQLEQVTLQQALEHPTWAMGPKITIDCSTLFNKGLEVIEAYWLFGIPLENIDVVIHPQSIIHSMVEYIDGSIIAQMSEPSMKLPIQYALTYPERVSGTLPPFDFKKMRRLEFYAPDPDRFPCLQLAYDALHAGGSMPCFLNVANEVLVKRFLNGEIQWHAISKLLTQLMLQHQKLPIHSLDDVLHIDQLARRLAAEINAIPV